MFPYDPACYELFKKLISGGYLIRDAEYQNFTYYNSLSPTLTRTELPAAIEWLQNKWSRYQREQWTTQHTLYSDSEMLEIILDWLEEYTDNKSL